MTGGLGDQHYYVNNQTIGGDSVWPENSLATILENYIYTLTVAVANRTDFSADGFEMELFAGSPGGSGTAFAATGTVAISPTNVFCDKQLTFSVLTGNSAIGQGLYIRLSNRNSTSGFPATSQIEFDNVRMDATQIAGVPEPSTFA